MLAAACSGKSKGSKPPTPPKPGGDTTSDVAVPVRPPPPVEGIACSTGPCMFHPGSGHYHECLNAGAGGCFQYGRRCLPADRCVLDASGVYRTCTDPGEGACVKFGAPCAPAKSCAFDAASSTYRTCEKLDAGRCSRFGDPCQPAPAG